jgi:RND family efflux transporter MFP subunit
VDAIFYAGLYNAAWTVILALAAAAGARWWRSLPAVGHALWLLVLLKLVTPSLVQFALPYTDVRARDGRAPIAPIEPRVHAPTARPPVDLGPAVSVRVAASNGRPPEASHQGGVTGRSALSLPPVPRHPARSEITSKKVVPVLALSWLLGAVVCWSVVGLNSARFRRMIRSARPAPAALSARIGQVAERLGLRNIPTACLLPVRMSPMVWVPLAGPPHLVLPEELWGLLDATQQDAILAHELAHLKRRDHWVRRLEALACGLYWWDPVAWWARREVERAEERCCDAWVLWALPSAGGAYAEALVMTAAYLSGLRRPLPLGASGVGRISSLKGRLEMILSDPMTVSIKRTAPRALLVLGAFSLPFLPAPTSGGTPVAAAPVAAVQVPSGDQPAKAVTTPAEPERKPKTATTPGDQKGDFPAPSTPQETVRVMQPLVREVTDYAKYMGHIVAEREVELRARASGTVIKVYCRPGQVVKVDERLFDIDPRPYRAARDQAEAELERVRARRKLAQNEYLNTKSLFDGKRVVSQVEVNLFEVKVREADAAVKVAEAALDASRLNLEFTWVTAPFAGRVSGPVLGQGNVAVADTTRLATIVSMDPACVTFNVDEGTSLRFNRLRSERRENKGEAWVGLPVDVSLADETDFPRHGKVDSIEVGIETATGTARWRALVPNPDGLLLPGMSVTVRLAVGKPHKVTLVPEEAVLTDGDRKSVFVVTGQDIVQRRPVRIGLTYNNGLRSVEDLQVDEWVVISGPIGLKEGTKVQAMRVPQPAEASPSSRGKQ